MKRTIRTAQHRVLGVIAPIVNKPECSNAACHAHPATQRILGILDTGLSLKREDASLAQSNLWVVVLLLSGGAVRRPASYGSQFALVLHTPLKRLQEGTQHLAEGELGYQIPVDQPTNWDRSPMHSTA